MQNKKLILGYWDIRGRCQFIRFLLQYLGQDYTAKHYTFAPGIQDEWFKKDKLNINMDYPNLPYIIDGDYKLSDSVAILNYLPLRYNKPELLGRNIQEQGTVQQLNGLVSDLRGPLRDLIFDKNWQQNRETQLEKPRQQIDVFNKILGKSKWLVGDNITVADFYFYEYLHIFRFWDAQYLNNTTDINRFTKDFETIPSIANYLRTDTYKSYDTLFPKARVQVQTVDYINNYNAQFK